MLRMQLETLRALTRIADRPGAAIDFPQDVFDKRFVVGHLDMFAQFVGEPEFLCQLV